MVDLDNPAQSVVGGRLKRKEATYAVVKDNKEEQIYYFFRSKRDRDLFVAGCVESEFLESDMCSYDDTEEMNFDYVKLDADIDFSSLN
jgi:hypothetical protein